LSADTKRGVNLAELYGRRGGPSPGEAATAAPLLAEPDEEQVEDAPAFGQLRGLRAQAVMLELRLKTGDLKAIGYSYLVGVDYNPGVGIVIDFTGHKVNVTGRNLLPIFNALVRHRVTYIREFDASADLAEESATVVLGIAVEEPE
jgi:hypothetical protein